MNRMGGWIDGWMNLRIIGMDGWEDRSTHRQRTDTLIRRLARQMNRSVGGED